MANHSNIHNLRMLNPHKFSTYQFMKQYFSVSPAMFLNFDAPSNNPNDNYSYNDIIKMIAPFETEFLEQEEGAHGYSSYDAANRPTQRSQQNTWNAINSFAIRDNMGRYDSSDNTNSNKAFYGGSIFAAFIPVYTLNRVKQHREIGHNVRQQSGSWQFPAKYADTYAYPANFYATGIRQGNQALGGYSNYAEGYDSEGNYYGGDVGVFQFINGNQPGFEIDAITNLVMPLHRVENIGASYKDISGNTKPTTLILEGSNTYSVFKVINSMFNNNSSLVEDGISLVEMQLMYGTNVH